MVTKKDVNVTVGMNIKREREKAGYTQERFSEMIGMGVKNLSAVERGAVGISLSMLKKICQELSVSSNAILFELHEYNDVRDLTEQLQNLTPKQFEIVKDLLQTVLEVFAHEEQS